MENRTSMLKRLLLLKERTMTDCRDQLDKLIKQKMAEPESVSRAYSDSSEDDA